LGICKPRLEQFIEQSLFIIPNGLKRQKYYIAKLGFRGLVKGFELISVSLNLGYLMVYSHSTKKIKLESTSSHSLTIHWLVSLLYNSAFSHSSEHFRVLANFP